ncbi:MAG: aspartate kinase [Cyanobacteria bacterium P01_A01_bin.135]
MGLIVQKFGGTSVGSVERIQAVAQRAIQTAEQGHSLVVVVSAMGKTTDQLVKLANDITPTPSRREMDMLLSTGEQVSISLLSMAIQAQGHSAVSLTGAQVGIVTEAAHTRARIVQIRTDRIRRHLSERAIVVVAGFQGIAQTSDDTDDLEITTLGRGGSDTSAVALAAALGAEACEIYTDVPGILTTDPRLVPGAQLMDEITADEMLELASLGAKVLHPRAVEIARNYGLTLVVRSSWTSDPGTRVISPLPQPRSLNSIELAHPIDAIEVDTDQAKIAMLRIPDRPGIAATLFQEVAAQDLDVDLIIQSIHDGNLNDIAFTVDRRNVNRAEAVADAVTPTLRQSPTCFDQAELVTDRDIAKISIVGAGMIGRPGVAAQMFTALAEAGVNIALISTSEVKVSCVIRASHCDQAVAALCSRFSIRQSYLSEEGRPNVRSGRDLPPVRGVALDTKPARVAIRHVPDRPGMASRIFATLADRYISVDTIIQSQRCRLVDGVATRDIAFTVAQADAAVAQATLQGLAAELEFQDVTVDTAIAKVSVVGAGMVGRPGVAVRMFTAIAEQQINIQMIATSEIKISCVVAEADGAAALQAVHEAFELSKDPASAVS